MARGLAVFLSTEALGVTSVGLAAFAAGYLVFRARRRSLPTPEQMEARRRAWIAIYGKLAGGEVVDVQAGSISYTYSVRGINYTAWQDVSSLSALLPDDRWTIIGGVGVRYDPRNPANSIILAETWTGLRPPGPQSEAS